MKKTYKTPDVFVINFLSADIITSSSNVGGGGGADITTPDDEF